MTSFYRIQTADRDPADLVDTDHTQASHSWYGPESYDRPGVSVCGSLEELATYLAHSAIPYGTGQWVIVELRGDVIADADPMDAQYGEILVYPTEIVSVRPMGEDMYELIDAAYDAAYTA